MTSASGDTLLSWLQASALGNARIALVVTHPTRCSPSTTGSVLW